MKILIIFILFSALAQSNDIRNYLNTILKDHPDYYLVQQEEETLENSYWQSFSNYLPKLYVYGLWTNRNYNTDDLFDDQYDRQLGAQLDYNLFNSGSDYFNLKAQRFKLNNVQYIKLKKSLELENQLLQQILNFVLIKKEISILKDIVNLQEQQFKISKNNYQQGKLSRLEFHRLKIDLINSKENLIFQESEYQKQLIKMNQLTPLSRDELFFPFTNNFQSILDKLKASKNIKPLDFVVTSVEENYLDLSYQSLKLSNRSSLDLSLQRYKQNSLLYNDWGWSASLTLKFNLFDGFIPTVNSFLAKKKYLAQKKKRQMEFRDLDMFKHEKLINLNQLLNKFNLINESKSLANTIYQESKKLFNRGQISTNDLLVEQNRMVNTQLTYYKSLFQLNKSIIDYCHFYGLSIMDKCSI